MGQEPAVAELHAFAFAIEMLHECCDHTTEVMMTQCTTLRQMRQCFYLLPSWLFELNLYGHK